jgi:hypothetical protein
MVLYSWYSAAPLLSVYPLVRGSVSRRLPALPAGRQQLCAGPGPQGGAGAAAVQQVGGEEALIAERQRFCFTSVRSWLRVYDGTVVANGSDRLATLSGLALFGRRPRQIAYMQAAAAQISGCPHQFDLLAMFLCDGYAGRGRWLLWHSSWRKGALASLPTCGYTQVCGDLYPSSAGAYAHARAWPLMVRLPAEHVVPVLLAFFLQALCARATTSLTRPAASASR